MSSAPLVAVELQAPHAIQRWMDMTGPTDPAVAREIAPSSLRARYGTGQLQLSL